MPSVNTTRLRNQFDWFLNMMQSSHFIYEECLLKWGITHTQKNNLEKFRMCLQKNILWDGYNL